MSEKIKIILVDDEVLIRRGITTILQQEDNFEILSELSDGLELMSFLNETKILPNIILLDIKMPNLNGIDASKQLVQKYPNIKIIILSSYFSEVFVSKMIEIGAVCYIPKNTPPEEMIAQINLVAENGFYYRNSVMNYLIENTPKNLLDTKNDYLSKREIEILHLICKQLSSSEIAEKLFISPRTVDGHRNNLLEKTKAKNIVGLVVYAIQHDLFSPEIDF